jgi:hypothetical protein
MIKGDGKGKIGSGTERLLFAYFRSDLAGWIRPVYVWNVIEGASSGGYKWKKLCVGHGICMIMPLWEELKDKNTRVIRS